MAQEVTPIEPARTALLLMDLQPAIVGSLPEADVLTIDDFLGLLPPVVAA
jgi:hypothetical protein